MQVLDGRVAIETTDEGQRLTIAGAGTDTGRELPSTFRVVAVEQDGDHVVLRADDGRTVRATPGQLASPGMPIPPGLDPDHQAHLDAELLNLPQVPAADADDPGLTAMLHDDRLGTILFDPVDGIATNSLVVTSHGSFQVRFWGVGHERVTQLLPQVHQILDRLPTVLAAAVEFLWQWGANGSDTADSHEQFLANFGVRGLSMYHCGAFSVELSDDQTVFAESFLDGYWPAVHFLPDGEPVFVTIES